MERVSITRQLRLSALIAFEDVRSEWWMSGCLVVALAAILAPLLVLFGLRFGVVDTMRIRLVENPRNLEVQPVGSGRFGADWFEAAQARPDVGFLVPRTRSIAATLDGRNPQAGRLGPLLTLELVPTALGDPLLPGDLSPPTDLDSAILSAEAARRLKVEAGQVIEVFVQRVANGQRERERLEMVVASILPPGTFPRPALFVPLELLVATEDYRDGFAVPRLGWSGKPQPEGPRWFASYRMFARDLDSVASVEAWLHGQGFDVRTRSAEIEALKALDRNLNAIFMIVALLGSSGYVVSLGASLWANVDRKRRDLSVLRLIGWQTLGIICFPVFQGALIAILGSLLAGILFLVAQQVLNRLFASSLVSTEAVCRLLPEHYGVAVLATVLAAVIAASWGGYRAAQIEPSEGIRDV